MKLFIILPHITIGLAGMIMVLLVLDMFINNGMNFINNDLFKWILLIFCVLVIILSIILISKNRKRKKNNR